MNLKEIVQIQQDFDREHGWIPDHENGDAIMTFLVRDLVGLFGELGEFANAVKKIQLVSPAELDDTLDQQRPLLKDELVDFMIYVLRFAGYLEIDLEAEYMRKLTVNNERFKRFLVDRQNLS